MIRPLFLLAPLAAASHTSAQLMKIAQAEILGIIDDDRIGAVSYTHLDVYKRQTLYCPVRGSVKAAAIVPE